MKYFISLFIILSALISCGKKDLRQTVITQTITDTIRKTIYDKVFIADSIDYGKLRIQIKGSVFVAGNSSNDTVNAKYGYRLYSSVSSSQPPASFKLQTGVIYQLNADINIWMGDWMNEPIEFKLDNNGQIIIIHPGDFLTGLEPLVGTDNTVIKIKYKYQ